MLSIWKTEFLERSKEIFNNPRIKKVDTELKEKEEALDETHRQIGQLTGNNLYTLHDKTFKYNFEKQKEKLLNYFKI
jgi:hypothetical protein